jgi:hypothetical protein
MAEEGIGRGISAGRVQERTLLAEAEKALRWTAAPMKDLVARAANMVRDVRRM